MVPPKSSCTAQIIGPRVLPHHPPAQPRHAYHTWESGASLELVAPRLWRLLKLASCIYGNAALPRAYIWLFSQIYCTQSCAAPEDLKTERKLGPEETCASWPRNRP